MSKSTKWLAVLVILGITLAGYTLAMRKFGSGTLPEMAAVSEQVDAVFVDKSERVLQLRRNGEVIRSYPIDLGARPEGHKKQEGDERTPTGNYEIDWRNANSGYHLSLHISYPNEADVLAAKNRGVSPGGFVMIHGSPNGWSILSGLLQGQDWTNGCLAVTNEVIREIWSLVPNGTPIEIVE